jgi:hypothetical protein
MSGISLFERRIVSTIMLVTTCFAVNPAFAAGSNMPWEQPLNQILQSVEGPSPRLSLSSSSSPPGYRSRSATRRVAFAG